MARKWWREAEVQRPSAAEFARVNRLAAIPVEIAAHHRFADDESSTPPSVEADRVSAAFLAEAHHDQYGGPWARGRYIFDFAVQAGLKPHDRLLDFGCGALRLGIWAIAYLDAGNYFGVDAHLGSLEAAATYEIPLHGLADKRPRLLWNADFDLSYFETKFDWIVDYSSSRRLRDPTRELQAVSSFGHVLAPGGRLLTSPRPNVPLEAFAARGLKLVRGKVIQRCALLEGHEHSVSPWFEFVRE